MRRWGLVAEDTVDQEQTRAWRAQQLAEDYGADLREDVERDDSDYEDNNDRELDESDYEHTGDAEDWEQRALHGGSQEYRSRRRSVKRTSHDVLTLASVIGIVLLLFALAGVHIGG